MSTVTALLDAAGATYRLHEHQPFLTEADWRNSEFPEERGLKTWAGILPDGRLVLAGLPGLAKLSYGSLARSIGVSRRDLRPASSDDLARIGMAPGGVCPVATGCDVLVVLDEQLREDETLFCGGGRPELTLEISLDQLCWALVAPMRASLTT